MRMNRLFIHLEIAEKSLTFWEGKENFKQVKQFTQNTVKLEDVCLAQFFSSYVSCQRPGKKIKFDDNCSTTY